jgi:hypothetical protein
VAFRGPTKEEQVRQLQQLQEQRATVPAVSTAATTPPSHAPAAPSAAPAGFSRLAHRRFWRWTMATFKSEVLVLGEGAME